VTFVCGQTINFMKVYGGGDEKLASTLGIMVDEAKRISEVISKVYAGTQKWMDENIGRLRENPVMFTLRGRHRRIEELQSTDAKTYKEGERLATNQACQAGARDVILGAMLQIALDLEAGGQYGTEGRMLFGSWENGEYKPDLSVLPKGWRKELPETLAKDLGALGRMNVQMFGQVHDELDLLWPKEHEDAAIERIVAMMQDPWGVEYQFSIPIIAEASSGLTWKEAK
jgi:DNA polymerase-1